MNLLPSWITFVYLAVSVSLTCGIDPAMDSVSSELRIRDQQLLDAIAVGGTDVWQRNLAPEAVYVDENGEILPRAEFLKQLQPLPKGVSGHLSIVSYSAQVSGDTAVVIHRDDEEENYHGQKLHAQYLTTETWQQRNDTWQLLQVHVFSVPRTPASIDLGQHELQVYEGKYSAGEGLTYTVKLNHGHLEGGRESKSSAQLSAEVRDVFFVHDQPRSRKIFLRDASGKITGFVDRREGEDLLWKKL